MITTISDVPLAKLQSLNYRITIIKEVIFLHSDSLKTICATVEQRIPGKYLYEK